MQFVQVTNLSSSSDVPGSLPWTLNHYTQNYYVTFADGLSGDIDFGGSMVQVAPLTKVQLDVPKRIRFVNWREFRFLGDSSAFKLIFEDQSSIVKP